MKSFQALRQALALAVSLMLGVNRPVGNVKMWAIYLEDNKQ